MQWISIDLATGVSFPVHRPSRGAPRSLAPQSAEQAGLSLVREEWTGDALEELGLWLGRPLRRRIPSDSGSRMHP
jgi:hypothetical protein